MDAFTHGDHIAAYDRAIEVAEASRAEARTAKAVAQAAGQEARNAKMRAAELMGEACRAYWDLRRYETDGQRLIDREDSHEVTG